MNILNGVAVAASNDVWPVGTALTTASPDETLIEHWDGASCRAQTFRVQQKMSSKGLA
ncbi:MAG TPA: hypothetical protein VGI60_15030 [Chthoniobacterales bacterium]